jgi:hypothetical protein
VRVGRLLLNPFASDRHELLTPLTPTECEARLDGLFADDPSKKNGWPRGPASQYPIWGEAWSDRFSISQRRRLSNPCQTVADGQFHRTPDGTRISLRLSHSRITTFIEVGFVSAPPVLFALDLALRPSRRHW